MSIHRSITLPLSPAQSRPLCHRPRSRSSCCPPLRNQIACARRHWPPWRSRFGPSGQSRVGAHLPAVRCVYFLISPPARKRRPAMMLPPRPRLRTTTPKTCPLVSTMRCWAIPSVVTIRISCSFDMFVCRSGVLHRQIKNRGSQTTVLLRRMDQVKPDQAWEASHSRRLAKACGSKWVSGPL